MFGLIAAVLILKCK
ncbi:hypothetical protein [Methanolobus sp. ZRKC1]